MSYDDDGREEILAVFEWAAHNKYTILFECLQKVVEETKTSKVMPETFTDRVKFCEVLNKLTDHQYILEHHNNLQLLEDHFKKKVSVKRISDFEWFSVHRQYIILLCVSHLASELQLSVNNSDHLEIPTVFNIANYFLGIDRIFHIHFPIYKAHSTNDDYFTADIARIKDIMVEGPTGFVVSTEKVSKLLRTHNSSTYQARLQAFLNRLEHVMFPEPTLICRYEPRELESTSFREAATNCEDDGTVSTHIDQQSSRFESSSSISVASGTTEGAESTISLSLHKQFIQASYTSPVAAGLEEVKAMVYGSLLKEAVEKVKQSGTVPFFSPPPKSQRQRMTQASAQPIDATPYPLPRPDHSPPDSAEPSDETEDTREAHDASFSSISMSPFTPKVLELTARGGRDSDSVFNVSSGSDTTSSAANRTSDFASPLERHQLTTHVTNMRTDDVERGASPTPSDFSAVKRLTSDQTAHNSPLTVESPAISSVGGSRRSSSRVTCAANPLDFERDSTLLESLPSLAQLRDDVLEEANDEEELTHKQEVDVAAAQANDEMNARDRMQSKRKRPTQTTSDSIGQIDRPSSDHMMSFEMDFDHGEDEHAYHLQLEEVQQSADCGTKNVKHRHLLDNPAVPSTAVDKSARPTASSSQNKDKSQSASRGAAPMSRASQRDGNNPFNVATLALYQTAEFHSKLVDLRRKKVLWTAEEEKALLKGVGIYGIGAWMTIKKDPLLGRALKRLTNEQLKDKFRNIQEKRAREGL